MLNKEKKNSYRVYIENTKIKNLIYQYLNIFYIYKVKQYEY